MKDPMYCCVWPRENQEESAGLGNQWFAVQKLGRALETIIYNRLIWIEKMGGASWEF